MNFQPKLLKSQIGLDECKNTKFINHFSNDNKMILIFENGFVIVGIEKEWDRDDDSITTTIKFDYDDYQNSQLIAYEITTAQEIDQTNKARQEFIKQQEQNRRRNQWLNLKKEFEG